jgi:hypothetical protein
MTTPMTGESWFFSMWTATKESAERIQSWDWHMRTVGRVLAYGMSWGEGSSRGWWRAGE